MSNRKLHLMLLCLILLGGAFTMDARNLGLNWVRQLGGTGLDYCQSTAVDKEGNVFTTGYYQNTVYFNLPDSVIGKHISKGSYDVFVTKHDANGHYLWSKSMGGAAKTIGDNGLGVAVDTQGNAYITGFFSEDGDFDPGDDTLKLVANGKKDVFITKLDANGKLLWSKSFGGPEDDVAWSLTTDHFGYLYLTGTFGGLVDFDPGSGNTMTQATASTNAFILKLDQDGNFKWVNQLRGYGASESYSVATDAAGRVVITGIYFLMISLEPIAQQTLLTAKGENDMFVAQLDSSGTFLWGQSLGGTNKDVSFSVALNKEGEVHIAGYFKDSLMMDPSSGISGFASVVENDYVVAKLSAVGKWLWLRKGGGIANDYGEAVAVDVMGNVYVAGEFNKTAYFSSDTASSRLDSRGNLDNFIVKYDPIGTWIWAKQLGGASVEQSNDIQVDRNGNIYLAGYFRSADANFDPDGLASPLLKATSADGFILKLICADTNSSVLTLATCDRSYNILGQTLTQTGVYPVALHNQSGCDSIVQVAITFNVVERPVITIDKQTLGTTGHYNTYQWVLNDGIINGAIDSTYVVTQNGNYKVIVTDANGCTDTSAIYEVTNVTAITDISSIAKGISLYPNPTQNAFWIQSPVPVQIVITSIEGKILQKIPLATKVHTTTWHSGLYFIRIFDTEGKLLKVEKLLISQ